MSYVEDLFFILQGVPATLTISLISFLLGFFGGILITIAKLFGGKYVYEAISAFENFIRGIPILILMLFLKFGVGGFIPPFKDPYVSSIVALGIRSMCYQSQIFFSAFESVGRTQMLAAMSLGFNRFECMRYVIVPQGLIVALPGLASEIALLIKDSSFAFILGVLDLMKHGYILAMAKRTFIFPYVATALTYIALTLPLSYYLDKLGSNLKTKYGLRV